jgi:predicted nucleic acid-binding protein
MDQVGEAWADLIENNSYAAIEVGEVAEYAPQLMAQFGLGSNDAIHAATALYADVRSIATLDTAFASVPGLPIFTDDGRVSVCRRRRAEGTKRGVRFDEKPAIE